MDNAGKFRVRHNSDPDYDLQAEEAASPVSLAASLAYESEQSARDAQSVYQRELVRRMRRIAPVGATHLVFELYSPGEDCEMLSFQNAIGNDGEEIAVSQGVRDELITLGDQIAHDRGAELGFEQDSEMFALPVGATETTDQILRDALSLSAGARSVADLAAAHRAVADAAMARVKELAGAAPENVAVIEFVTHGGGLGPTRMLDGSGSLVCDCWDPDQGMLFDALSDASQHLYHRIHPDVSINNEGTFRLIVNRGES